MEGHTGGNGAAPAAGAPDERASLPAAAAYAARADACAAEARVASRRLRRLGWARVAVFVLGVALVWVLAYGHGTHATLAAVALAADVVVFAALVGVHGRVRRRVRDREARADWNRRAGARVRREPEALETTGWPPAPAGHPYAADLDLFGRVGLVGILPPVSPAPGRTTLRDWLLAPAPAAELEPRQRAIAELAPLVEWRESLSVAAERIRTTPPALAELVDWLEPGRVAPPSATARVLSWVLPACTLALAVAQGIGWMAHAWWSIPVAVALLVAYRVGSAGRTLADDERGPGELDELGEHATAIGRYVEMMGLTQAPRLTTPLLARLAGELAGAREEMRRLRRLADWASARHAEMLHAPLQALLLWDVHLRVALARWRGRAGGRARGWLDALGSLEALAALAALAHENPSWCFAELDDRATTLEARALAHPLIAPARRVANDVDVGPPGTVLLITGSNMAGKSTLLRSIGLAAVMGQAGAPVCARRLCCPPLAVHAVIRVEDALERGVSLFMAELERIRALLADVDGGARGWPPVVLYLLDEMLRGTNSAERTVAAQSVLEHLLHAPAIGAVTTHDVALVESAVLRAAGRPVHFREQVVERAGRPAMTFDFVLRPGPATSSNALALMRIMGLPAPPAEPPGGRE